MQKVLIQAQVVAVQMVYPMHTFMAELISMTRKRMPASIMMPVIIIAFISPVCRYRQAAL